MALKSFPLSLASIVLALAACDQGPGGAGASVPAPNDVIDAVPTEDEGERGSRPVPVARPVARPAPQPAAEAEDDDAAQSQTSTTTLNTTPPKTTPPAEPPPIVIVPPAPSPIPEPAPED